MKTLAFTLIFAAGIAANAQRRPVTTTEDGNRNTTERTRVSQPERKPAERNTPTAQPQRNHNRETTAPRSTTPPPRATNPERRPVATERSVTTRTERPEHYRREGAPAEHRTVVNTHTVIEKDFRRPARYHGNHHIEHRHYPRKPVYIAPPRVHHHIVWTPDIHRYYREIYPTVTWHYHYGYKIGLIPAYDAYRFGGEVQSIYGRVDEVYYYPEYDYYYFYIGGIFPYQDVTIIVPGYEARRFSHNPVWYFQNRYIVTTGLISEYDRQPEVYVRRANQISLY